MSGNPYGQGGYGDFTGAAAEVYALFMFLKYWLIILNFQIIIELIVLDRDVITR